MKCRLDPDITDEEKEAMEWLHRVLENIVKDRSHKNFDNAVLVARYLTKLIGNAQALHRMVHELEATAPRNFAEGLAEAMLRVQNPGEA